MVAMRDASEKTSTVPSKPKGATGALGLFFLAAGLGCCGWIRQGPVNAGDTR